MRVPHLRRRPRRKPILRMCTLAAAPWPCFRVSASRAPRVCTGCTEAGRKNKTVRWRRDDRVYLQVSYQTRPPPPLFRRGREKGNKIKGEHHLQLFLRVRRRCVSSVSFTTFQIGLHWEAHLVRTPKQRMDAPKLPIRPYLKKNNIKTRLSAAKTRRTRPTEFTTSRNQERRRHRSISARFYAMWVSARTSPQAPCSRMQAAFQSES